MTTKSETDRKVALWERHGQTLLLGFITAVLSYAANALVESKTAQAATAAEVKAMAMQLSELRGAVSAMQLNYVGRTEFAAHEQRLQALERRKP